MRVLNAHKGLSVLEVHSEIEKLLASSQCSGIKKMPVLRQTYRTLRDLRLDGYIVAERMSRKVYYKKVGKS